MPATRRLILFIIIILLLLLLFIVVPSVSWSQTPPPNPWQEPVRDLAKKIVAITGPRQTFALTVRNISSLSDSEVTAVRAALDVELRAAGLRLAAKSDAAPELRITLSENLQGLLWVAEIPRDSSREVAMISVPRPAARAIPRKTEEFVMEKKLLWEQDEPIVAAGFLRPSGDAAPRLVVLSPTKLTLFEPSGDRYKMGQSAPLPLVRPWPRDLRGTLHVTEEGGGFASNVTVVVMLPRMGCWIPLANSPATLAAACVTNPQTGPEDSDQMLWMLSAGAVLTDTGAQFSASRNFLTGRLYGKNGWRADVEPFFSAAFLSDDKASNLTIHSGVDGRVRIYDGGKLAATVGAWGSELTSVNTVCGNGWQVLASRPGDWTEPDALTAYEIADLQAVRVTSPLEFLGPVKYLGPEFLPGSRGAKDRNNRAIAVSFNLATGRYEAYTLTLSCGR
jgi:hypothetical protein